MAPGGCSVALIGGLVCQKSAGETRTEFIVGLTTAVVKTWKQELDLPGGQVLIVAKLQLCIPGPIWKFSGYLERVFAVWRVFQLLSDALKDHSRAIVIAVLPRSCHWSLEPCAVGTRQPAAGTK